MSHSHALKAIVSAVESLRGANLQARSIDWVNDQLSVLFRHYFPIGIGRSAEQVWYRGRKCPSEEGHASLTQMIYPGSGGEDFGRANFPRSRVLYASWNMRTVFDEIAVQAGHYVQTIALRPIAGLQVPCHIVGEYQSILNSGGSLINSRILEQAVNRQMHDETDERQEANFYIDSYFAESFRRRVEHTYEYKATAAFAEKLHKANGGLMYPSVQTAGGINIALPATVFDANFEVMSTEVHRIDTCYGYGLNHTSLLRSSCDFESDGTINWSSHKRRPATWNLQEGVRMSASETGWRKPATGTGA